ncbi:glycoside hydrolase family 43 protein [Ferruginibacter profundus]
MKKKISIVYLLFLLISGQPLMAQQADTIKPGTVWRDDKGEVINAHGGAIIFHNGTYYWFGEKRGRSASEGVNVYSSTDLYHWKFEALALAQDRNDSASDIAMGCVMERPKVLYNALTKKFVLWFHLELRGKGYSAARAAVAVSDQVTGPYKFISSFRPNGNMSRDMTLYEDDNGAAYLIYSSRENYDLRIARLTDDFLSVTAADTMLFSKHREAPAVFKKNNTYYLITSGCTGWKPNKASLHTATNLFGPWVESDDNPMSGPNAAITFDGQSTFVLPVENKKEQFIFIADKWNPADLKDSRYIWLPINFKNEKPVAEWKDEWSIKELKNKKKNN